MGEVPRTGGRTIADRERWLRTPSRSVAQVLDGQPGLYLRLIGESGSWIGSSLTGGQSGHDGFLVDALPAGDPLTGRTNLSLVPLEHLESIEQLSDEEASLTGHRWNLITRQFSSVRPVTAIRFAQEPDETILSDGLFSQNVARSTALTLGFQRHTSGGRFTNAALDAWDLRGRVRTNLADWLNLAAFWNYGRSTRGVNGGVNIGLTPSIFNDVSAVVERSAGYEINERTDLGLTGVARLFDDSLSITRISVLNRDAEREYRRLPDLFNANEQRQFARATDLLYAVEQRLILPYFSASLAAQAGSTRIGRTEVYGDRVVRRSRIAATGAITALEWLTPRAAAAVVSDDGDRASEIAAGLTLAPGWGFRATTSASVRPVFPTLHERWWTDTTVLRPTPLGRGEDRSVKLEVEWAVDSLVQVTLAGFRRDQRDVVIARPALTAAGTPALALTTWSPRWTGLMSSGLIRLHSFELSGSFTLVTVSVTDTLKEILPQWWGTAEFAYQGRVFRDQLGFRAAVRSRFSDRLRGLSPDPATGFEVANNSVRIGRAVTVDVYGTMEIGQAFVTLSWENLTDAETLRTAVYPMPGRQFKLGVRWVFTD